MVNFDEKGFIESAESYRVLGDKAVIGYDTVFDILTTYANITLDTEDRILLVGGGGGRELSYLSKLQKSWAYTVIDPSQKMIDYARYWAKKEGVLEHTEFHQGLIQQYVPSDEPFQLATCIAVLHYLSQEERKSTLDSIYSLLEPSGSFLWTVANKPTTDLELALFKKMYLTYPQNQGVDEKTIQMIEEVFEQDYKLIDEVDELSLAQEVGFQDITKVCATLFFNTYIGKKYKY
ncbi:MAG TPA: hypothetical protein DCS93_37215 [Microscillaceae bacterium]|nr:hypothetical protein [Microscillaceae bacterium]